MATGKIGSKQRQCPIQRHAGGKVPHWGKALCFFAERSERFWQPLHSLVRQGGGEKKIAPTATSFLWLLVQFFFHRPLVRPISKDIGDRTSAGPFFDRSTISQHAFVWNAIFVYNQFLSVAALWRSTCKPCIGVPLSLLLVYIPCVSRRPSLTVTGLSLSLAKPYTRLWGATPVFAIRKMTGLKAAMVKKWLPRLRDVPTDDWQEERQWSPPSLRVWRRFPSGCGRDYQSLI